ncbi:AAA family ATPase [Klebsiella quasipneumoniae]|uniref:AAA family ATPase n=1 Tax=Klebsiella quasipneumoniae TaxID=1463165 RepID=UPI00284B2CFB|nr:AAA family ATPase [Klebsiella quasipneumoniae]EIY5117084.1 AAA family ATPase [Klebsiella quasipneumoniae]MDR4845005.1 AAA family ATPase [Klebsiella quasipneumoniae]HCI5938463.1 AAA family ATPase [Klebsiella quasipneumoniae subsp. quasipneumoniae]
MDQHPLIIKGYKSIAELSLVESPPFITFAGANGAGKSNITDALAFFGAVVKTGATQAIRDFGGFQQIHCYKLRKENRTTASLHLQIELGGKQFIYDLTIKDMDKKPTITEKLVIDGDIYIDRKHPDTLMIRLSDSDEIPATLIPNYSSDMTALMLLGKSELYAFLTNIVVFRIDPLRAKEPDSAKTDSTFLDSHGRNIASVLAALESNSEFKEQILEWMELIVPGMENVSTEKQKLDGSTVLTFKEQGTRARFPAHLISDGTIFTLCIMTAILSRAQQTGMTIIEEPERGIHPKAIGELVQLMRENASLDHPIVITTHSESIVRNLEPDELWFVSKKEGKTQLMHASDAGVDKKEIPLDTAWLMNMFDGGLPW